MDGQVPESLKYEDWLETKDKDFQDDVLGVGKAKLWRDGKITFTQMVDQRGNELTLKEIRSKYGL